MIGRMQIYQFISCAYIYEYNGQLACLSDQVLPAHFTRILPNKTLPVSLTCSGKKWEMIYLGKGSRINKFGPTGWKTFVVDNMLKVGDFCVFELMENSDVALNFKVRILRGGFPSVFENKEAGTIDNPIVLE